VRALFKTVHEYHPVARIGGGRELIGLCDDYRHEIAAYELDKLLGLGIVPPCVERTIRGDAGALCLWVESAMTETRRKRELGLEPPDAVAWSNQMCLVRLFLQLVWDADADNISNILVDGDWRVYKIDSSRAFRHDPHLRDPASLYRFSRCALDALRALSREQLELTMAPWLDDKQIAGLWARRSAVLAVAERRIQERGPAILY
jgi:hypothetical protein